MTGICAVYNNPGDLFWDDQTFYGLGSLIKQITQLCKVGDTFVLFRAWNLPELYDIQNVKTISVSTVC